jgi:hypothetical protein
MYFENQCNTRWQRNDNHQKICQTVNNAKRIAINTKQGKVACQFIKRSRKM